MIIVDEKNYAAFSSYAYSGEIDFKDNDLAGVDDPVAIFKNILGETPNVAFSLREAFSNYLSFFYAPLMDDPEMKFKVLYFGTNKPFGMVVSGNDNGITCTILIACGIDKMIYSYSKIGENVYNDIKKKIKCGKENVSLFNRLIKSVGF